MKEFFGSAIPKYAILSHRWSPKEVTFQDLPAFDSQDWASAIDKRSHEGLLKIAYACFQAANHGLEYVWVDTCCIDKSSSAELSEAINSMYEWYRQSDICYAYLDDVHGGASSAVENGADPVVFTSSQWFTRGWTLQELLAPLKLKFYGVDWMFLGDRTDLSKLVSKRTRIPEDIVENPSRVRYASIASRMSWAAGRQTTRIEDVAYSLLGIFNVNIPLLYGEGKKAFIRLQEEILRESDDQTIFAWEYDEGDCPEGYWFPGPLADSPARFAQSGDIIPLPNNAEREPYTMTNKGLRIEVLLSGTTHSRMPIAILNCRHDNDFSGLLGIYLKATSSPPTSTYMRAPGKELALCRPSQVDSAHTETIHLIKKYPGTDTLLHSHETCILSCESIRSYGFHLTEVAPIQFPWNSEGKTLKMLQKVAGNMAAFKFYNSHWDQAPIVIFALTSNGVMGRTKVLEHQGGGTLQQLLERESVSTKFFRNHSILLPPYRNSTDRSTKLTMETSVKKIEKFGEWVYVLDVGIKEEFE